MSRKELEPNVYEDRGETVMAHPAFGQIAVSRIHGSRALYGSDFMHHNYVRIRIMESQLRRDMGRDWFFGRRGYIEVDLSEAQWATFVSSFNIGEGVPCTISAKDGQYVPEFPLRDSGQLYKIEANEDLKNAVKALHALEEKFEKGTTGLSKKAAAALAAPLRDAVRELESNLPFIADSFSKHMEKRVEKAKVEVEAHINNAVRAAGLKALREGEVVLELPNDPQA